MECGKGLLFPILCLWYSSCAQMEIMSGFSTPKELQILLIHFQSGFIICTFSDCRPFLTCSFHYKYFDFLKGNYEITVREKIFLRKCACYTPNSLFWPNNTFSLSFPASEVYVLVLLFFNPITFLVPAERRLKLHLIHVSPPLY